MSWVLILSNGYTAGHPAVIGGYASQADAERAGDLATAFEPYEEGKSQTWPYWMSYVVVPAAGAAAPRGTVHCIVENIQSGTGKLELVRRKRRFEMGEFGDVC